MMQSTSDRFDGANYFLRVDNSSKTGMYCFEFAVTGAGLFPFDMLRRDHCFPIDEGEATSMGGVEPLMAPRRVIKLRAWSEHKWWRPTYGRWRSFGWSVVMVGEEPKEW